MTPGQSSRTRDPKHSFRTPGLDPSQTRLDWIQPNHTQGLDWARLDRTEPTLGLRGRRASERCPLYHSLHSLLPSLLSSLSTVKEIRPFASCPAVVKISSLVHKRPAKKPNIVIVVETHCLPVRLPEWCCKHLEGRMGDNHTRKTEWK